MKKIIMAMVLGFSSTYALAFHRVTEILPSGKMLICKDYGQVKKGNIVEVYTRNSPRSRSDVSTSKTSEFKLPETGQRIKLTHRDFHSKGRNFVPHAEELGTAIVSSESIEGEERISHVKERSRSEKVLEKVSRISNEDAIKIHSECIIVIPEKGLKLNENAYVSWE